MRDMRYGIRKNIPNLASRILSLPPRLQTFGEQRADELRVGRAVEAAHHRADEDPDQALLAVEVNLPLIGLPGQNLLHNRNQRALSET